LREARPAPDGRCINRSGQAQPAAETEIIVCPCENGAKAGNEVLELVVAHGCSLNESEDIRQRRSTSMTEHNDAGTALNLFLSLVSLSGAESLKQKV
jgi:hypothetical protein